MARSRSPAARVPAPWRPPLAPEQPQPPCAHNRHCGWRVRTALMGTGSNSPSSCTLGGCVATSQSTGSDCQGCRSNCPSFAGWSLRTSGRRCRTCRRVEGRTEAAAEPPMKKRPKHSRYKTCEGQGSAQNLSDPPTYLPWPRWSVAARRCRPPPPPRAVAAVLAATERGDARAAASRAAPHAAACESRVPLRPRRRAAPVAPRRERRAARHHSSSRGAARRSCVAASSPARRAAHWRAL